MANPTTRRTLGSRWPIIVILALLGTGAGYLLSSGITPRYDASAELLLEAPVDGRLDGRTVATYGHVLGGRALLGRATESLGIAPVPADDVRSGVVGDTGILRVTVRDHQAADAAEIAKQLTTEFTAWLKSNQDDLDPEQRVQAVVIDPGSGSSRPVEPRLWPYLLSGLLIGILLGLAVARWRQHTDHGIDSVEELEEATQLPTLGSVAFDRAADDAPLLTSLSPQHPRAEATRILRTNLQFVDLDTDRTVIVVTSAMEGEGKTTTACNLAIALAQSGQEVVLVEGDLRRPRVADYFGLANQVGLTTALVGRVELAEAVQETDVPGLDVLASGSRPPNPAEILQTGAMERLVHALRGRYDAVIIDAPPVLPVADASVLSLLADGAILVVRHNRTGQDQVAAALDRLRTIGATVFGTVLSMTPRRAARRYGYGYEYSDAEPGGRRRA